MNHRIQLGQVNCTVMFVDLEGSTQLKYEGASEEEVVKLVEHLFCLISDKCRGAEAKKFTGDGAMIVFPHATGCNSRSTALEAAKGIIQGVDRGNVRFQWPKRAHVRIGIASGNCYVLSRVGALEVCGSTVDLAARLCSEADRDEILLDGITKSESKLPEHRFAVCSRRLSLKGVPLLKKSTDFFHLKIVRLHSPTKNDSFSSGLLALYADRRTLARDLPLPKLLYLTAPRSEVLLAGRTLVKWTELRSELLHVAKTKLVKFNFLLSSLEASRCLGKEQQQEIKRDLPRATEFFACLQEACPKYFEFRITEYPILDGVTCAYIRLPGYEQDKKEPGHLIVQQDINAAAGDAKASLMFGCTCKKPGHSVDNSCMAHGLRRRTSILYDMASKWHREGTSDELRALLLEHTEELPSRRNLPTRYLGRLEAVFRSLDENNANVPPPLSVHLQVTGRCNTQCVMCQHFLEKRKPELSLDDWKHVFTSMADFGVRAAVFSGGEPLMREDLPALLKGACDKKLRVGLLTNGMMDETARVREKEIITAIKTYANWVAISIDGTEADDLKIRRSPKTERTEVLRRFCRDLEDMRDRLSATVTLQRQNIGMDIRSACEFANSLGIRHINFKFATGAIRALADPPEYLLDKADLDQFISFLWNDRLPQEQGNNLAYLRRCFANGVFDAEDVIQGVPVYSLYREKRKMGFRCFTPFLFAFVDADGSIYPCCHLFRDNHGNDRQSMAFRRKYSIGNLTRENLKDVWRGSKYSSFRSSVKQIDPDVIFPCGECTRHCQHNRALNRLYEIYKKSPNSWNARVNALRSERLVGVDEEVWF